MIYPGSAGGDNINILTRMFPQCYWYLIDPRDHYKPLYSNPKVVEIKKEYFTEETALYYKNKLRNFERNRNAFFLAKNGFGRYVDYI